MTATMEGPTRPAVPYSMYVDGFGTARRVQALCRLGWSLAEQAQITRRTVAEFEVLLRAEPVPTRVAYQIDGLYRRLVSNLWRPGPAADETRAWAAAQGWASPLEWTADTIDDPAAVPTTTPRSGTDALRAWLVNYLLLEAQGLTRRQIAAKLCTTTNSIQDRLYRARRGGLLPKAQKPELQPCGTSAARLRHWRKGEPLDPACAAVHR